MCRYIFMVMHSFVPLFREAKFCGVPPYVFDKLGCAVGEKKFAEHCVRCTNYKYNPESRHKRVHRIEKSFHLFPVSIIIDYNLSDEGMHMAAS
jgi:hypothetical protein